MVSISTPVAVVLLVFFIKPMAIEVAHLIIARHIISARNRSNSSSADPEERKKIVIKSLVISVSEDNNRKIESVSTFM